MLEVWEELLALLAPSWTMALGRRGKERMRNGGEEKRWELRGAKGKGTEGEAHALLFCARMQAC